MWSGGFLLIASSTCASSPATTACVGAISLIDQIVSFAGQAVTLSLPFAAMKFLSAAYSEGREQFGRIYGSFAWALITTTLVAVVTLPLVLLWKPALLGSDLMPY